MQCVQDQCCTMVALLRWDPMCLVQLLCLVCPFPIKRVEEILDGRMEAESLTNALHSCSLQKFQMSKYQP